MAKMNTSTIVELKEECQRICSQLNNQTYLYGRRRFRFAELLRPENQLFQKILKRFPAITAGHWEAYGEFKRSFDLFGVQFQEILANLEGPVQIHSMLEKPQTRDIQQWQDYCDDLKDELKDRARTIEQQEKDSFLMILRILDTAERFQIFTFPETDSQGERYHRALSKLKAYTVQFSKTILRTLHRRRIHEISLVPGAYPPIQTTRILYRDDNQTNDEIMISKVAEKGYTWKRAILRKAAVVVITKS